MQTKVIFVGGNVHSGNTFFCQVLKNIKNTKVFDGEARFFKKKKRKILNKKELAKIIKSELKTLNNFKYKKTNYKISYKDLNIVKFRSNFGKQFFKLIKKICFDQKKIYIQKATSIILSLNNIDLYGEDYKVIFLLRNPFNIYNSIKFRNSSFSILRFIFKYFWVLKLIRNKKKRIYILKYENLILNFDFEIRKIEKFLKLKFNKIEKIPIINTKENKYTKLKSQGLLKHKTKINTENLNKNEIYIISLFIKLFKLKYYKNIIVPKINYFYFFFFMIRETLKLILNPPQKIFYKLFN